MARKLEKALVARKDLDQAFGAFKDALGQTLGVLKADLSAEMGGFRTEIEAKIGTLRTEFKADFSRLAMDMDRRFAQTASQASLDALTAKVDRFIAALDRTSGEQQDNRRSLVVYDYMLGEHRRSLESHERRICGLESRVPPLAP